MDSRGYQAGQRTIVMQKIKSSKVKKFVKNFDFSAPDWEELPNGFFSFDTRTLSNEEQGIYSGIVFAWIVDASERIKGRYSNLALFQNPVIYNSFQVGKILLFILSFILITGNLLNLIFIEIYHTIL